MMNQAQAIQRKDQNFPALARALVASLGRRGGRPAPTSDMLNMHPSVERAAWRSPEWGRIEARRAVVTDPLPAPDWRPRPF